MNAISSLVEYGMEESKKFWNNLSHQHRAGFISALGGGAIAIFGQCYQVALISRNDSSKHGYAIIVLGAAIYAAGLYPAIKKIETAKKISVICLAAGIAGVLTTSPYQYQLNQLHISSNRGLALGGVSIVVLGGGFYTLLRKNKY